MIAPIPAQQERGSAIDPPAQLGDGTGNGRMPDWFKVFRGGSMGEWIGNFGRQYPWHLIAIISLAFILIQAAVIYLAKKYQWTIRIRPIQIAAFVVLFVISVYCIITGKSF